MSIFSANHFSPSVPGLTYGRRPEYRKPLEPGQADGVLGQFAGHATSALQTGLQVLDGPGALVRGGIGSLIGVRKSDGDRRTTGRDLTDAIGLTRRGDKSWLSSGLGVGAEILTDPLSYLSFGTSSALTGSGRALAKTGALRGWSRAQKLKGFDALESGLSAAGHTASDIAHARDAGRKIATPAQEAAVSAAGSTLQAGQPLAGLAGVGLPFQKPSIVLMSGPKSQKVAGAIDKGADYLAHGNAVGRSVTALFNSKANSATGPATQRAMIRYGAPALEDAGRQTRADTFDVIYTLDGPIQAGASEPELLRAARQAGEGLPLRPAPGAGPLDPSIIGPATAAGSKARGAELRQLQEASELGLPLSDLSDRFINYVPRTGLDVEAAKRAASGGVSARMGFAPRLDRSRLASVESAVLGRDEAYRNVPGGTARINDLVTKHAGNPFNLAPSALARTIRRDLLADLSAGGLPITPAARRLAKDKAAELAPKISALPSEHSANGIGLFSDNLVGAVQRSGQAHAKAVSNAKAMYGLLGTEARPLALAGVDAVPVSRLLDDLGFVTEGADAATGRPIRGAMVQAFKSLASQGAGKADGLLHGPTDAIRKAVDDFAVPRSVADELTRTYRGWTTPTVLEEPLGLLGNLTSTFRNAVYPIWPASHFKNALGAAVVNAGDGIGPKAHAIQVGLMRGTATADELRTLVKDLPAGLSDDAARDYVRRQQYIHAKIGDGGTGAMDLDQVADRLQSRQPGRVTPEVPGSGFAGGGTLATDTAKLIGGGAWKQINQVWDKIRHPFSAPNPFEQAGVFNGRAANPLLATGRRVGESIENTARGAAWLGHRGTGLSPEEAGRAVLGAHFDYSALSDFERKVMRNVFPFYSFMRFNTPARLSELAHTPALPMAQLRALNAGRDEGAYVPEYLRSTSALPLGPESNGKRSFLTSLGLPIEEALGRLRFQGGLPDPIGTTRATASGLNPLLRTPTEIMTGRQLATGRDLSDMKPSGTATALGRLMGDERPTALSSILSGSPASRFVSSFDKILDDRKNVVAKMVNLGTGLGTADVDVQAARDSDARRAIMSILESSPRVARHINVSPRPDEVGNLTSQEIQALQALATIRENTKDRRNGGRTGGPIVVVPSGR